MLVWQLDFNGKYDRWSWVNKFWIISLVGNTTNMPHILFWCIKVSDVIIYNFRSVCYSDRSFKTKMNKPTWIFGKAIGSARYGSDLFTNFSVTAELHPSAACKIVNTCISCITVKHIQVGKCHYNNLSCQVWLLTRLLQGSCTCYIKSLHCI